MKQNQVRQNPVTGEWVLYATERGKRPSNFNFSDNAADIPEYDENCPFCPGNENQLPETLLIFPYSEPQTRTVFNKYPVIVPEESSSKNKDFYLSGTASGRHEVIIETPVHNLHPALMREEEVFNIIEAYHLRYTAVMNNSENFSPLIFRNHGKTAGTSLIHPHSQFIVTDLISQATINKQVKARHYYEKNGECIFCAIVRYETEDGCRVINNNEFFLTFIPFFAEVPCEIWIVPKRHIYSFGEISADEKKQLAADLKFSLMKIYKKLNNPAYNYMFYSDLNVNSNFMHWHLQILPRLTTKAGFELGTGISVNTSMPEADAEFLKND